MRVTRQSLRPARAAGLAVGFGIGFSRLDGLAEGESGERTLARDDPD
jgi:hypothetical protein